MPRNVEIKARVRNFDAVKTRAKELSASDGLLLEQEDVFFPVSNGRLKLRSEKGRQSQLIFYDRPDTDGPKLSEYETCVVPEDSNLVSVLSKALGNKGIVRKKRLLFMAGQTRIHVDRVQNLGDFMELEVCLEDHQTLEEGQAIAKSLMNKLGIPESDCISGAYMDMLSTEII